jgi:hypothetical protein
LFKILIKIIHFSGEMTCKFGNLTLAIGNKLKANSELGAVCVGCICEVPPLLTCKTISNDNCEETYIDYTSDPVNYKDLLK